MLDSHMVEVSISEELIVRGFTKGYITPGIIECTKGLPPGSHIRDCSFDVQGRIATIRFLLPGHLDADESYSPEYELIHRAAH